MMMMLNLMWAWFGDNSDGGLCGFDFFVDGSHLDSECGEIISDILEFISCMEGVLVDHVPRLANQGLAKNTLICVARAQVGVANINWDATVATYALNYVNSRKVDCNLVHSNGTYGENLAKGSGSFTGVAAVNLWVAEKQYYVYNSNSCVGGQCLHYTQVVWRDSVRVGCARVQCNNGWWFVTCNYDPPGNYVGEKPY
ncbi:hypothetical protein EZV62_011016 [Acer yangbiense]|uniref:Pathogenesis-related protein 1 n=1 Tax=Acer yangbiense TaxID=1000413 RepID=A0A5C7I665_9ROSI|nr:hypothetical protein EZV62_011016 [Acer yangbiense]